MFLFYEITAGENKEHFICKFFILKLTPAVFSYTEKNSQKLDRDSIRMHRESQKKKKLSLLIVFDQALYNLKF